MLSINEIKRMTFLDDLEKEELARSEAFAIDNQRLSEEEYLSNLFPCRNCNKTTHESEMYGNGFCCKKCQQLFRLKE